MEDSLEPNTEVPVEDGAIGENAPAVDGGQGEAAVAEQAQPELLDLDTYGSYVVQLDDETTVPVSELRDRGLRQADYTRKTQELSEQRKELEDVATLRRALDVNPEGTIRWLAEQRGIQVGGPQSPPQNQAGGADDWLYDDTPSGEETSPVEQRLMALERQFES